MCKSSNKFGPAVQFSIFFFDPSFYFVYMVQIMNIIIIRIVIKCFYLVKWLTTYCLLAQWIQNNETSGGGGGGPAIYENQAQTVDIPINKSRIYQNILVK